MDLKKEKGLGEREERGGEKGQEKVEKGKA